MDTDLETYGNRTIACESCGHLDCVEIPLFLDLRPLIRCSECCHPQSLFQNHLTRSGEVSPWDRLLMTHEKPSER